MKMKWGKIGVITAVLAFAFGQLLSPIPAKAEFFSQINLVTDDQAVNPAMLTDSKLKNAWGISFGPTTPFWVSDNASGVSTLYDVNPVTNVTTKNPLEVSIPGDGSVTGQAFNTNSANSFNGDRFLFVSEDGTISGWRPSLGTSAETIVSASSANVYKGTALATINGNTYLYAANFRTGMIDVIKGTAAAPNLTGNFTDASIPAGYAPFDIRLLNDKLYVSYALQDSAKHDDAAGPGHGFVNVFDTNGNLLGRVATQGTLNSPWGMTIAPASFKGLSGDLIVGNFGDGRINAFDLAGNTFVGQLLDTKGNPITIDGLWGLTTGNSALAGSTGKIYFSAGPNGEADGLFGVIQQPVPEPGTMLLLGSGIAGMWPLIRRRFKK